MEQLLLHLFGDYIIQNDWMALHKKDKTKDGWFACFFHCLWYSLPFLLITNIYAVLLIGITHFIIDRGYLVTWFLKWRNRAKDISNFGFHEDRPFALTIWLNIITDNTFHLIINYLIILFFNRIF